MADVLLTPKCPLCHKVMNKTGSQYMNGKENHHRESYECPRKLLFTSSDIEGYTRYIEEPYRTSEYTCLIMFQDDRAVKVSETIQDYNYSIHICYPEFGMKSRTGTTVSTITPYQNINMVCHGNDPVEIDAVDIEYETILNFSQTNIFSYDWEHNLNKIKILLIFS